MIQLQFLRIKSSDFNDSSKENVLYFLKTGHLYQNISIGILSMIFSHSEQNNLSLSAEKVAL